MKNKKWKIIMLEIEMKNKKGWLWEIPSDGVQIDVKFKKIILHNNGNMKICWYEWLLSRTAIDIVPLSCRCCYIYLPEHTTKKYNTTQHNTTLHNTRVNRRVNLDVASNRTAITTWQ